MLKFNSFDPYAILSDQASFAKGAKDAKDAKVIPIRSPTLAGLATLAAHTKENTSTSDAEEWRYFYNERAGIAQNDGNLTQAEAEHLAYEACIARWLNKHSPVDVNESICPHCGERNGKPGDACIPTLIGQDKHIWLHHDCHLPWLEERRKNAITELCKMDLKGDSYGRT